MKIFFLFAALLNQIIDRSIFALMTLHSAGQLNNFVRLDIESSLSFYSMFYAEACNEFVVSVSASLRRATQLILKKMS